MNDQMPFGTNDFAMNPEPRCPCVLLLDTSGSMGGQPITELNQGLTTYKDELAADALASKRVEVSIVTFGGRVDIACDFTTAESFQPPTLSADGDTPMGAAIVQGLQMLQQRKDEYKRNGISYFRPWVFLITDGAPTDGNAWETAAEEIKQGESRKAFTFFAVGVEGANFDVLKLLSTREPLKLKGLRFRDLFQWLSSSQRAVSSSKPGDSVPLKNPATPDGWASTTA